MIYPDYFQAWAMEKFPTMNNIISQGIAGLDLAAPFTKGGEIFTLPLYKSLNDLTTGMQQITRTTTLTAETMSDMEIKVPAVERGDAIQFPGYDKVKQGIDPNNLIGDQIATLISNSIQTSAKNVLNAAFDDTAGVLETTHKVDYSGIDDGIISTKAVGGARFLLGESGKNLVKLVVNAQIFADLWRVGMSLVPASTFAGSSFATGLVPSIAGMEVLINDSLCAQRADLKYPCYLMGVNPFYVGVQKPLRVETDRNILLAGGTDIIAFTIDYGIIVDGVSYTSTTMNPTDAQLLLAASYTKKKASANIEIIQLLINKAA